jgi:hypothetical protein
MLVVEIDGHATLFPWGEFRSAVPPGDPSVSVGYRFLGMRCGRASLAVPAADSENVALQYRLSLRLWNWSKGNLWEDHRYET